MKLLWSVTVMDDVRKIPVQVPFAEGRGSESLYGSGDTPAEALAACRAMATTVRDDALDRARETQEWHAVILATEGLMG